MPKVKITRIDANDAYHDQEVIGLEGEATNIEETGHGLFAFDFKVSNLGRSFRLMYAEFILLDRTSNKHYGDHRGD